MPVSSMQHGELAGLGAFEDDRDDPKRWTDIVGRADRQASATAWTSLPRR